MSGEFKTLFEYLKSLHSRYFNALSAFFVYEGLLELGAPNIVGQKEAKQNVETMSRFKNFFVMIKEALKVYFLLELAKLFDESKQSLHVNKIINFAESNIKALSKNDFLKFHQDRPFVDELFKHYRAIDNNDLKDIKNKIETHKVTIRKLNDYRNQHLAHKDKQEKKVNINRGEIRELFSLIAEILNLFSLRLDFSITIYKRVEEECKSDTKKIIEYLKRFEPYRLKEIDEKYKLCN